MYILLEAFIFNHSVNVLSCNMVGIAFLCRVVLNVALSSRKKVFLLEANNGLTL